MARFISRHIRIASMSIAVLCVILCAGLAARAANHVIEGKYLGESADSPLPRIAPTSGRSVGGAQQRTKDGAELVERNMFCSECALQPPAPDIVPENADEIPLTALPIELLATNLSGNSTASFATIRNTRSSHQGSFFTGNVIPGAGPIERVAGVYVVFRNNKTDRAERISLRSPPKNPARPATLSRQKPNTSSPYSERVKKIDDRTYAVERAIVQQVMANPTKLGARAIPAQKDGAIIGFRLYGMRRNSPLVAIGLRSGDTIRSINGYEFTSPDKMLEAYEKLKTADNLTVTVLRRGTPVEMRYQLQ